MMDVGGNMPVELKVNDTALLPLIAINSHISLRPILLSQDASTGTTTSDKNDILIYEVRRMLCRENSTRPGILHSTITFICLCLPRTAASHTPREIMLADPSLWTSFHRARDALLNALRDDIYATRPPIKAIPPASTKSLLQAISQAEREIETAKNELSRIRSYLAQSHAIVTNWSSSLAMLPYELIQGIASYVIVTPGRQREIMRLSHVSKKWREAVLAMPRLFSTANWNTWPCQLIDLWCQRAGTQPLNISLGDRAIDQLRNERGSELMRLLNSRTSQWGRLEICFEDVRLRHSGVRKAVQRLLQGSAPLLHHLTLFTDKSEHETTLLVLFDCPLPLNVYLSGVWVLFGTRRRCSSSVTDLTLQLTHRDQLSRVVDVLSNCPLIQRLELDLAYYSGGIVDLTRTTQTTLSSLIHLDLHNIRTENMAFIGKILRCFNTPNLNSITVVPNAPDNKNLLPLLVKCYSCVFCSLPQPFLQERAIPNAQNISVLNYHLRNWDSSSYQLECLGMEPTIFTHLTELHLLYEVYYIDSERYSRLGKVIQDLVRFREGSITHLTTPPFDDNIMEVLRGRVPHIKVCHSGCHLPHVECLSPLSCRLVLQ